MAVAAKCCCAVSMVLSSMFCLTAMLGPVEATSADVQDNAAGKVQSELRFDIEPSDVVAVRGRQAVFDCRASVSNGETAGRQPDIYWIKDGTRLKYDARRYRATNGSLVIDRVEYSLADRPDDGVYQCAAKHATYGTIVSRRANLTIAYINNTFVVQPVDVSVAVVGDIAAFVCRAGVGQPRPRIRWFREDAEVKELHGTSSGGGGGNRRSSEGQGGQQQQQQPQHQQQQQRYIVIHSADGEGVLEIGGVRTGDAGRYRCLASAPEGLPVAVGGSSELLTPPRYSRHAQLHINASSSSAAGGAASGGRLTVPQFVLRPRDAAPMEGSALVLPCVANGRDRYGSVPRITWLKDSNVIDFEANSRLQVRGQGTLTITDVQASDTGTYICRATNAEDSADAFVFVNVRARPRFTKRPLDVVARAHSDTVLECDVDTTGSNSPATIEWLKNGDPIVASDYFLIDDGGRKLSILGLVPSDSGMYQCTAVNSLGMVQTAARLVVVPKDLFDTATAGAATIPSAILSATEHRGPAAPEDLAAALILASSVRLTWKASPATLSNPVVGYMVYWQEDSFQRERSVNTTGPGVTINHLKPSTKYLFNVAACDVNGPGTARAQITVDTLDGDTFPSAPTNLRAVALSSTSLLVEWDGPAVLTASSTGSDAVAAAAPTRTVYYRLYYFDINDPVSGENDMTVTEREVELIDLCKYCEYSLRVVAYSPSGPSTSSEEITCRTWSDVPTGAPQNVTLETISSSSIVVNWEPPAEGTRNGLITGYKIRYKQRGEKGTGDSVTTDGSRRSFELTGLVRSTEYSIRLLALNVNGTGPPTPWLTAETYAHDLDESTVPGKPASLRIRPMTNSIVVSWTPPVEQDILIRGYVLGYGIGFPDVFQQVLDARQRYFTVRSLQASSEYVVTLKAYNNIGEGEPIYETVYTREETTPEPTVPLMPPVGVDAVAASSSSVIVSWSDTSFSPQPSVTFGGDGRIYTIRYGQRSMRGRYHFINVTTSSTRIDDLRPDTEYEISVRVSRGTRQSMWSMSVFVRTREAAPTTAPRHLAPAIVDRRPAAVTLSWQPPSKTNGQITGYVVYYTTDSTRQDSEWPYDIVNGDRLSTTIRDLRPDTTYYFKIAARNRVGLSPMSPTVIFRTPRSDGSGGGMIETPHDQNILPPGQDMWPYRLSTVAYGDKARHQDVNVGVSPLVLWIAVGSIAGVLLAVIVVTTTAVICCRRKSSAQRLAALHKSKALSSPKLSPQDVNPPDLWIHGVGGSNNAEPGSEEEHMLSAGRPPSSRGGYRSDRSSVRHYELTDDERYSTINPMQPLTPSAPTHDPLMRQVPSDIVSVDSLGYNSSMTSPYQRSMYSSVPRVNVGDIGLPPHHAAKPSKMMMPGISASFRNNPPTAAAVIFTSRPQSSPRHCTSTTSYMTEMSKFPRLDTCQMMDDLEGKELSSEIAGLEGLMKDLGAISSSQRQFD